MASSILGIALSSFQVSHTLPEVIHQGMCGCNRCAQRLTRCGYADSKGPGSAMLALL